PGSLTLGGGGRVLYVARRGAGLFVVSGGSAEGPYAGVASVQVDREGAHAAYVARRGEQAWAVLDGREDGPHEALAELQLAPRGGGLASIVRRDGRWWVRWRGYARAHES